MTLRELLRDTDDLAVVTRGDDAVEVRGITADSRTISAGDLFFALPGTRTDGGRYVTEALERGAVAIAGPPSLAVPSGLSFVATPEPARLLARAAARFHGNPTAALTMVGVTGTNGKTTVTYLLEAIWQAAGLRPGVFGTISYRFGGTAESAPLTTPPAPELFARLARMRAAGATHIAMEASSHALAQGRVDGVEWDAAVFTNLGRDHLDFHRDQDAYFAAKARLFSALDASPKRGRVAVLNAADRRAADLRRRLTVAVVTFGAGGDVRAEDVQMTLEGTEATLVLGGPASRGAHAPQTLTAAATTPAAPAERVRARTRLIGAGHLENVLAAAATAYALGTPAAAVARGIGACTGVPGRLEPVAAADQDCMVLVDFAHTPEALAGVLGSLRTLVHGRLLCVFGCGGDRDRGKRPLMGEAVGRNVDLAVLTSDNPRTEDPHAIIADAEPGLMRTALPRLTDLAGAARGYVVVPDRAAAIATAIGAARAGDCVVIAGKGHEDYQIVGTTKRAFDDRTVARRVLAERRGAAVTWLLDDVVRATGAEVLARGTATEFSGVATDTRTLTGGELFVALRGPRYDAHHFATEAAEAGARGLVVERTVEIDARRGVTVLAVPDALRALQELAAALRRRHAPTVLGVTGSNGKTTTKEMLGAVLGVAEGPENVLKTSVNLNNLIGVPLTLLRLTGSERHAVIEMGMSAPGEIWRLAEIADPDVGVITNVGPAHLEGVGSIAGVARAKGELFARMRPDAVAVANADDPHVAALADAFAGRVVRFSAAGAAADVVAEDVRTEATGAASFRLRIGAATAPVCLQIAGRHNVANALAAAAAAHAVGTGIEAISAGLITTLPVGNRMRVVRLASGVTIVNDSYNANPASVAAALGSLQESAATRRIAVLGDMLELGPASAEHHRHVGRLAAALGVDALYLFGDHAENTAAGARSAPAALSAEAVHVLPSHAAIADAIARTARAGDWVLVKGSRGQRMEEVVRLLGAPQ